MDPSVVDPLFDAFGPFLLPAVVFAAGVVGYGVLFLVGRLLDDERTAEWSTGTSAGSDESAETDREG